MLRKFSRIRLQIMKVCFKFVQPLLKYRFFFYGIVFYWRTVYTQRHTVDRKRKYGVSKTVFNIVLHAEY